MYGGSYLGFTQYMAAGQVPPHLAAIVPEKAGADLYTLLWNGGILRAGFIERWTGMVRELDVDKPAPPVDGPEGEALLRAAVAEHRANRSMAEISAALPYRDSVDAKTGIRPWIEWSPITYRKEIERSGVAIYHLAGWFDRYVIGQTVLFKNLDNPQRITIGPWSHVQDHELDFGAEHQRFYDYWLKGIDNGIAKEDPVHYYVMGSGWRSARQWPLPEEKRTSYWFAADGRLTPEAPPEKGRDTLAVDYSASVWPAPRWSLEPTYPEDLSANDAKGITYTTLPLTAAVEVTGHPVVRLWVSADVADADLFVYLEEVDAKGASHYVTEGSLRASHRATADPGFDYLGMPWHRSFAADAAPLPKGEPVELAFDLFPTSNLFDAGHRIRVTVTGSDKANALTPEQTPPPRLVLHREKGRASHIAHRASHHSGPPLRARMRRAAVFLLAGGARRGSRCLPSIQWGREAPHPRNRCWHLSHRCPCQGQQGAAKTSARSSSSSTCGSWRKATPSARRPPSGQALADERERRHSPS